MPQSCLLSFLTYVGQLVFKQREDGMRMTMPLRQHQAWLVPTPHTLC